MTVPLAILATILIVNIAVPAFLYRRRQQREALRQSAAESRGGNVSFHASPNRIVTENDHA